MLIWSLSTPDPAKRDPTKNPDLEAVSADLPGGFVDRRLYGGSGCFCFCHLGRLGPEQWDRTSGAGLEGEKARHWFWRADSSSVIAPTQWLCGCVLRQDVIHGGGWRPHARRTVG